MARLPAAIAVASGMSESPTGKFHGDMIPDDAERLVDDARAAGAEVHFHVPLLRTHPAFELRRR